MMSRLERLTRAYADARAKWNAARATGDHDGERYAAAECRRLARVLAEGVL